MIAALLAAAPALPLDEAGKYVAGAFIVFVAVIVIYVGIMGVRLQRMSREMAELNRALDMGELPPRDGEEGEPR
jgi:hypothetical protein